MLINEWMGQFAYLQRCWPFTHALVTLVMALVALFGAMPAHAHEGQDHEGSPIVIAAANPRAVAQSEAYEVVAVLKGDSLAITVDRFADNAPADDAKLIVTIGKRALPAEHLASGIFKVIAEELRVPGTYDLVFDIQDGAASDLLISNLEVPKPVVPLGGASPSTQSQADKQPAAIFVSDTPHRIPDGSVFLPKATQRLLDVRTLTAIEVKEAPRAALVGRVVANPNRSGVVQSTIGGRFSPPAGGLPHLGQPISAGDVLGYVAPVFAAIDTSDRIQTAGDLDQQIDLVTSKLNRLRPLAASGAVTKSSVTDAEIELKGFERRRAALRLSSAKPEPLVAPIDGILASMKVLSGQVVTSQDQLFHIVDTKSLWVEALVFDPTGPSSFTSATGTTQNGTSFDLSFVGEGRILQQQSTVLNFAILNPPTLLRVGTPVSVLVPAGEQINGILMPKAAVVRASNGENLVWLHTNTEQFEPRPVRVVPFDGDRVLIVAGLQAGDRVTVRSAELINQVR